MKNAFTLYALACCLILGTAGCIYHPPIEQGNVIEAKAVKQLYPGMSSHQVTHLLGKPVLTNVFKDNRLVYVYTFESDDKPFEEKRLVIYFKNGSLTRYTADTLSHKGSAPHD